MEQARRKAEEETETGQNAWQERERRRKESERSMRERLEAATEMWSAEGRAGREGIVFLTGEGVREFRLGNGGLLRVSGWGFFLFCLFVLLFPQPFPPEPCSTCGHVVRPRGTW